MTNLFSQSSVLPLLPSLRYRKAKTQIKKKIPGPKPKPNPNPVTLVLSSEAANYPPCELRLLSATLSAEVAVAGATVYVVGEVGQSWQSAWRSWATELDDAPRGTSCV